VVKISRLLKTYVSFAKEPYTRDYILQTRHTFLKILLIIAKPPHITSSTCALLEVAVLKRCMIECAHFQYAPLPQTSGRGEKRPRQS